LRTITVRRTSLVRAITGFRRSARLAVIATFAGLLSTASPALAQVSLGSAESFAVLGASTVTSTGGTVVTGDLGVSSAIVPPLPGFPPGVVVGTIFAGSPADPTAVAANADLALAYLAAAGATCVPANNLTGSDLGTLPTLTPGVYCFNSSVGLTGTLVLDAQGDPNAEFIFQIGSTLTTAIGSSVVVINPGTNMSVHWQVGSSATIGTGTAFIGNILAQASITLTTGASLSGRALARDGAVTMDSNAVSCGSCDGNDEIPGDSPPAAAIQVEGNGQIRVPKPDSSVPSDTGAGKASLGFHARSNISGVAKGRLNYVNHVTRLHIRGPVDDIVVIATNPDASPKTVRLSGTCDDNLPACAFSVTVEDNGRSGRGTPDQFGITVTGAMSEARSQRVLSNGDIRVRVRVR